METNNHAVNPDMACRQITYREALDEGLCQSMESNPRVVVMGCGVDDCKGLFGTTLLANKKFGNARVFDTPLAENTIAGIGVGLALTGWHPVIVHARNDFMLLAMDQIINHAAKWRYMTGGALGVSLTMRAIVGRGWGQAAQHSQSLQALFAHVPGLKVVMPSNAYDAKGLLIAAIQDKDPVLMIEHRWLFEHKADVPAFPYTVPIGRGKIVRQGKDATVVAVSHMVTEAMQAAGAMQKENTDIEVIDLRSVRPLDEDLIFQSVRKTGRLVVADTGWRSFGIAAEIAARVQEKCFGSLKAPVARVCLPDVPTPCSPALEKVYYPGSQDIQKVLKSLLTGRQDAAHAQDSVCGAEPAPKFNGPF